MRWPSRPFVHAGQPFVQRDRCDRVNVVRDLRSAMRAFAPFSAAAVLAWTVAPVGSQVDWGQYALSTVLALVAGALAIWATRERDGSRLGLVPAALLFLAGVAFLRNSVGGLELGHQRAGDDPGVPHRALQPLAPSTSAVVVAGVGLFYLLPILIVGPPSYPHSQYRSGGAVGGRLGHHRLCHPAARRQRAPAGQRGPRARADAASSSATSSTVSLTVPTRGSTSARPPSRSPTPRSRSSTSPSTAKGSSARRSPSARRRRCASAPTPAAPCRRRSTPGARCSSPTTSRPAWATAPRGSPPAARARCSTSP